MRQIKTLHQLAKAAENRKAVISGGWYLPMKPMPAAVLINMTGSVILKVLNNGLYIYERNKKQ